MQSVCTFVNTLLTVFIILAVSNLGAAIRCYQCASSQDPPGIDNCGAYKTFDTSRHIAINCDKDESHMPGSFCMKVTQQGPRGFIWDGRWRQIIRRCASVAETGVTGVCNWGVYENGVYWEECYCSEDECNTGTGIKGSVGLAVSLVAAFLFQHFLL